MVSHGGDSKVARVPEEIVLDASVAVKWFTEEKNTDLALEIRDCYFEEDLTLYAPDLIIYEVENALRFKGEGESFSDVVMRLTGGEKDKMKGFGSWSDTNLRKKVEEYREELERDIEEP